MIGNILGVTTGSFVLNVADLLARPGSHRSATVSGRLDIVFDQARLATRPVVAQVELESLSDGVLARAEVEFTAQLICNRCLTEWEEINLVELAQLYGPDPDEEGYAIRDATIDLEGPLHDEVSLSLPMAPLCDAGCLGLCSRCGADLNTDPCSGHPEESVSPLAKLADLFGSDAS